jgi:hypothetical protein
MCADDYYTLIKVGLTIMCMQGHDKQHGLRGTASCRAPLVHYRCKWVWAEHAGYATLLRGNLHMSES